METRAYTSGDEAAVLDLSLRTRAPVFPGMRRAVPDFVYDNFSPDGWEARQKADPASVLHDTPGSVDVSVDGGTVTVWMPTLIHPEDRMGEVRVLAVDPEHQHTGVASALMDHAGTRVREAGMDMDMVKPGGDPGHAPTRRFDEGRGVTRRPVARYFRQV